MRPPKVSGTVGGLWLAWQHRRATTLSIAAARSPERTAIYVRVGFMF